MQHTTPQLSQTVFFTHLQTGIDFGTQLDNSIDNSNHTAVPVKMEMIL
jgi:hypothetical protein